MFQDVGDARGIRGWGAQHDAVEVLAVVDVEMNDLGSRSLMLHHIGRHTDLRDGLDALDAKTVHLVARAQRRARAEGEKPGERPRIVGEPKDFYATATETCGALSRSGLPALLLDPPEIAPAVEGGRIRGRGGRAGMTTCI